MVTHTENVDCAKLALHAERFDDMMTYMEAAAQHGELSPDEVCGVRFAIPADDQLSF